MIGSCSEEIASFGDHLSSDPAGAVSGQIYGYDPDDGRYEDACVLLTGMRVLGLCQ